MAKSHYQNNYYWVNIQNITINYYKMVKMRIQEIDSQKITMQPLDR